MTVTELRYAAPVPVIRQPRRLQVASGRPARRRRPDIDRLPDHPEGSPRRKERPTIHA